eukprot:1176228-Prorocentrum_minimum.AAC.3
MAGNRDARPRAAPRLTPRLTWVDPIGGPVADGGDGGPVRAGRVVRPVQGRLAGAALRLAGGAAAGRLRHHRQRVLRQVRGAHANFRVAYTDM